MSKISKIKFDDNSTIIEESWFEKGNAKDTRHTRILPRHPDFINAMAALGKHVIQVLDLPEDYENGLKVQSVAISQNETQGRGVVVTSLKYLEGISAPFVMNTPHLHQDLSDNGKSKVPFELDCALDVLVQEARLYLGGKSSQLDMFEGDQPETKTEAA